MRRLNKKSTLKVVKELDAFPKIPESYQQTTSAGGTVSILCFLLISVLVFMEFRYYSATEMRYDYEVDGDFSSKLNISVDITVASRCEMIGADILDLTYQNAASFGRLKEELTYFELSKNQRAYWDMIRSINGYIKEEYHAVHKLLWKTGYVQFPNRLPEREEKPTGPPDACRFYGVLTVNKLAGNFHVTAGKPIPQMSNHAHLSFFAGADKLNYSHRIERFSFGNAAPGAINPLDGDEKVTDKANQMYQYFIKVVPTKVNTNAVRTDTHQYSVTERERAVDHAGGSHGVPGIYFKYDVAGLKVSVTEQHKSYWQFLVRLSGIIGGVFATSGMLHAFVGFLLDIVCCRYRLGRYREQPDALLSEHVPVSQLGNYDDDEINAMSEVPPGGVTFLPQAVPNVD